VLALRKDSVLLSVEQAREGWLQLLMNCKGISAIAPNLQNFPVKVSEVVSTVSAGAGAAGRANRRLWAAAWLQWFHTLPL